MNRKSILNPQFQYRGHLHTDLRATFARARAEIGEQKVIKLPPAQSSGSHMRKESK